MKLYGISNCDTVKKARRWLSQHNIDYSFHDLRRDGLDEATVQQWLDTLGAEILVNKRSTTWKNLDTELRNRLDETMIAKILAAHPTLAKRPILNNEGNILAGFSDSSYKTFFNL
ncbi:MAG: ArsC family reductase [Porticoccaceae bacterium]